jgi:hypothetical protein
MEEDWTSTPDFSAPMLVSRDGKTLLYDYLATQSTHRWWRRDRNRLVEQGNKNEDGWTSRQAFGAPMFDIQGR